MAVELTISWIGRSAADFSRVFKVAANVNDFKPALKQIAQEVIAPSTTENFGAGGRPSWVPLAPFTIAKKGHSKILIDSGALQQAATDPSQYTVSREALWAWPSGVDYWKFHQTGDGVPKRVIMMMQAADRTAIMRIFADYMRTFLVFDPRKPGARLPVGG